jgi:hypothetical protein
VTAVTQFPDHFNARGRAPDNPMNSASAQHPGGMPVGRPISSAAHKKKTQSAGTP